VSPGVWTGRVPEGRVNLPWGADTTKNFCISGIILNETYSKTFSAILDSWDLRFQYFYGRILEICC
jgi:hypothetical protein